MCNSKSSYYKLQFGHLCTPPTICISFYSHIFSLILSRCVPLLIYIIQNLASQVQPSRLKHIPTHRAKPTRFHSCTPKVVQLPLNHGLVIYPLGVTCDISPWDHLINVHKILKSVHFPFSYAKSLRSSQSFMLLQYNDSYFPTHN